MGPAQGFIRGSGRKGSTLASKDLEEARRCNWYCISERSFWLLLGKRRSRVSADAGRPGRKFVEV